MAGDIAENMSLDDLISFTTESLEQGLNTWEKEDLAEEWEFRFEDEPNLFK
jgi:hypothetical protein